MLNAIEFLTDEEYNLYQVAFEKRRQLTLKRNAEKDPKQQERYNKVLDKVADTVYSLLSIGAKRRDGKEA